MSQAWGGVLDLSWIGLSLCSLNVQRIYSVFVGKLAGCLLSRVSGKDICGRHLIWKPCTTQPFESNLDKPLSTKSNAHCVEAFQGDASQDLKGLPAVLLADFHLFLLFADLIDVYVNLLLCLYS